MRFGFHVSIAGSLSQAIPRAIERGCQTIQIFSRNPRGWAFSPIDEQDAMVFKEESKAHDIMPVFVHMPYLANLASPDKDLCDRSVRSLIEDLKRSGLIGAGYVIMHVGSAHDAAKGLERMSCGINEALAEVNNQVRLLLENTAGSGSELGHEFGQLRTIIDGVKQRERVGMVLDTAHAFAAGYDLGTASAVAASLGELDRTVGLDRLFLVHLNDSKFECGSRRDRHWHIGKGMIGSGMRHILRSKALQDMPFIMETPRTGLKEDTMNMAAARRFAGVRQRSSKRPQR